MVANCKFFSANTGMRGEFLCSEPGVHSPGWSHPHPCRRCPQPGRNPPFNTSLALLSFSLCQRSAPLQFPFKTFENPNDIYKISLVTFVGPIVLHEHHLSLFRAIKMYFRNCLFCLEEIRRCVIEGDRGPRLKLPWLAGASQRLQQGIAAFKSSKAQN